MTGDLRPSDVEVVADGLDHPEAVIWDPQRQVLLCGGEAGQLYAVRLDGTVEVVARTGGSLLGLALHPTGLVFGCDAGRRELLAIDPGSGGIEVLSRGVPERRLLEPNGIAVGADGTTYFTCSGMWGADDGAVYCLTPDGRTDVWSSVPRRFPNGCLIHGPRLLVVESRAPGVAIFDRATRAFEASYHVPGAVPDQIICDSSDALVVGCYRPDAVLHLDAAGAVTDILHDPSGMLLAAPTGCAFAGPGADVLVVANHGGRQLLALSTPLRGPTTQGGSARDEL
jgi:sugar lactone lactonase YvrE